MIAKLRADYGDEDGSFLAGMVEAFADESRALQLAAQDTSAAGKCAALAQLAHRLKSAAGTLGARHVVALCVQLEAAAKASDVARVGQIVVALGPSIVRARAVLKRIVAAAAKPAG